MLLVHLPIRPTNWLLSTQMDRFFGHGAAPVEQLREPPGKLNGEALDQPWLRSDGTLGGGRIDLRLGSDPTRFPPPTLAPDSSGPGPVSRRFAVLLLRRQGRVPDAGSCPSPADCAIRLACLSSSGTVHSACSNASASKRGEPIQRLYTMKIQQR